MKLIFIIKSEILLIIFLSLLLTSCLSTNTAIESDISKKITETIKKQQFNQNEFPYPKGLFIKYEDFKNKIPNQDISYSKSQLKHILSTNYQLRDGNGKRIKEPFAVSNGNELLVRGKYMKNMFAGNFSGTPTEINNDYLLAYFINDNFIYFENDFNTNMIVLNKRVRYGIIYSKSKNEFIVLGNSSIINEFIKEEFPEFVNRFHFSDSIPNLLKVRNLMSYLFDVE